MENSEKDAQFQFSESAGILITHGEQREMIVT